MKHTRYASMMAVVFVSGLLSSCGNLMQEPEEVVRRWYEEMWNKGDVALVDEIVVPKYPVDMRAVKASIRERRAAFPNLRFFIQDMIVERNKVVTRWVAHGTHQGVLRGVLPTGRQITFFGISIGVVNAGKIIALWECWDALGVLEQIGAVPKELNIFSLSSPPLQQKSERQ